MIYVGVKGLIILALLKLNKMLNSLLRALALTLSSSDSPKNISSINESKSKDELFDDVQEDSKHKDQNRTTLKPITARARHPRTITPFIATHDIPRGILYSLQMFMMYLLMLAVMCAQSLYMFSLLLKYSSRTFQAAFFISIVVGLGIGEMLFGRLVGRMAVAPL